MTQADVARAAGVSPRTVSNVVNRAVHVSPGVRARVERVVTELGYAPNLLARGLRERRSGLIAVVLPLAVTYFAELTDRLVREAARRGLTVMIDESGGAEDHATGLSADRRRLALFDGMIIGPTRPDALDRLPAQLPVVLVGQGRRTTRHDQVVVDNVAAATAATEHLIGTGARRIAFLGPELDRVDGLSVDRLTGYRAALRAAGLRPARSLEISTAGAGRADGLAAVERLLRGRRPDAVCCHNDPLAQGVLRGLHDHGLQAPPDLAVIGWDDNEEGRFSTPRLSTISQDKDEIARVAIDRLVARIGGDTSPPVVHRAGWTLLPRESTSPS